MDINIFNIILSSFLVGAFASTLAAGPVTLMIFRSSLLGNYMKSVSLILGAAIMEAVYCFIALTIIDYYFYDEMFQIISKVLSVIILFFVGIYVFRTKFQENQQINTGKYYSTNFVQSFLVGFTLVGLNPSIILTWSVAAAVLISFGVVEIVLVFDVIIFTVFALIGNISGGFCLVLLVKKFNRFLTPSVINHLFKFIGIIVILFSVYFVFDLLLLY